MTTVALTELSEVAFASSGFMVSHTSLEGYVSSLQSLKQRQNWDCCCGCELELYDKKEHCEVSFCTSAARSMHLSLDIPDQPTLM